MDRLTLNEAQRRRVGAVSGRMRVLVEELRGEGVEAALTEELERRLDELDRASGVLPAGRGDLVGGALVGLWILACELRPSRMAGYGALGEREHRDLDAHAAALEAAVERLRAELRRQGDKGGDPAPRSGAPGGEAASG